MSCYQIRDKSSGLSHPQLSRRLGANTITLNASLFVYFYFLTNQTMATEDAAPVATQHWWQQQLEQNLKAVNHSNNPSDGQGVQVAQNETSVIDELYSGSSVYQLANPMPSIQQPEVVYRLHDNMGHELSVVDADNASTPPSSIPTVDAEAGSLNVAPDMTGLKTEQVVTQQTVTSPDVSPAIAALAADVTSLFSANNDTVDYNDAASVALRLAETPDIYNALAGNDTVYLPNAANKAALGYDESNAFNAGAGNDTVIGGDLNDTINGGAGNDDLTGGGGNDILNGGEGNDIYRWSTGDGEDDYLDTGTNDIDQAIFTATNGQGHTFTFTDLGGGTVQLAITEQANTANIDLQGVEFVQITGTAAVDNVTIGDLSATALDNFVIDLAGGNDVLQIHGNMLTDDAILSGGAGTDTLQITGGGTFSALDLGGIANDFETWQFMGGSSYSATLGDGHVGAGNTLTINGNALGAGQSLTVNGGAETDGQFNMTGGAGDDDFTGGQGADTFTGGNGDDTFRFGANSGVDTINDFNVASDGNPENDLIDLTAYATNFGSLTITDNGFDTTIHIDGFGGTNKIVLIGVDDANDVTGADFMF
jgi:Ca2+-binding RTX toxin-like protein